LFLRNAEKNSLSLASCLDVLKNLLRRLEDWLRLTVNRCNMSTILDLVRLEKGGRRRRRVELNAVIVRR
jgi:hypothetical protein